MLKSHKEHIILCILFGISFLVNTYLFFNYVSPSLDEAKKPKVGECYIESDEHTSLYSHIKIVEVHPYSVKVNFAFLSEGYDNISIGNFDDSFKKQENCNIYEIVKILRGTIDRQWGWEDRLVNIETKMKNK